MPSKLEKLKKKLESKRAAVQSQRGSRSAKITHWATHKGKFKIKAGQDLVGTVLKCTERTTLVEVDGVKNRVVVTGDTANLDVDHTTVEVGDECLVDVVLLGNEKPWLDVFTI